MSGKRGIPANRGKVLSEAEFRRMWLDPAVTLAQMAEALGITPSAVSSRGRTRGLPRRRQGPPSPITDPNLNAMWRDGVSRQSLADHYGVWPQSVGGVALTRGLKRQYVSQKQSLTVQEWQARTIMAAAARETHDRLDARGMIDKIQGRAA